MTSIIKPESVLAREEAESVNRKYEARSLARDILCAMLKNPNKAQFDLVKESFDLADEFTKQWEARYK